MCVAATEDQRTFLIVGGGEGRRRREEGKERRRKGRERGKERTRGTKAGGLGEQSTETGAKADCFMVELAVGV